MLTAEAPKITDWMQAWGSLAGLVMSTAAVIFTGLLFRHEIRVRREEQRDNEAALARLVVAEFYAMDTTEADDAGRLRGDLKFLDYRIRNLNAAPILNVSFALMDILGRKVYPCPENKAVVVSEAFMGVIFNPPLPLNEYADVDHLIPVVRFTDANGLKWIRQGTASPMRDLSRGLGRGRGMLIPQPKPDAEAPVRGGGQAGA